MARKITTKGIKRISGYLSLQYPAPAGLTLVSKDQFWRAVYDKVPPPPPKHFQGADKITIHEDTNGDGKFDTHKTFLVGLNIVTAVEHGRGGPNGRSPRSSHIAPGSSNTATGGTIHVEVQIPTG